MKIEVFGKRACGGRISGRPVIVLKKEDLDLVCPGDILITKETDISFVPAMMKASAVVTEVGGRFCHAAIWAREHNKPTVLQIKNATQIFKGISEININANEGKISWVVNPKT